jgi:hypothetical protein
LRFLLSAAHFADRGRRGEIVDAAFAVRFEAMSITDFFSPDNDRVAVEIAALL